MDGLQSSIILFMVLFVGIPWLMGVLGLVKLVVKFFE